MERRASVVAVVAALGCTGSGVSTSETPLAVARPDVEEAPAPVVEVGITNGNTLRIFKVHDRILVTEEGTAPTTPMLPSSSDKLEAYPDGLVGLFKALRPDLPVPDALAALQVELSTPAAYIGKTEPTDPPHETRPPVVTSSNAGESPDGRSPKTSALLEGCNNGCCDRDWTFGTLCQFNGSRQPPGAAPYFYFFQFNSGFSTMSSWENDYIWTAVCAAVGASNQVIKALLTFEWVPEWQLPA